jgi:hypothetical protein
VPVDLTIRCELCDLPLATCPHGQSAQPVTVDAGYPIGVCITAKYEARCPSCRERIRAGIDLITFTDDGWVHAEGCV